MEIHLLRNSAVLLVLGHGICLNATAESCELINPSEFETAELDRTIEDPSDSLFDPLCDPDETATSEFNLPLTDAANLAQLRRLETEIGLNTGAISANDFEIAALDQRFREATRYVQINGDGVPASATGLDAIAIGEGTRATKGNSMAVGTRATAQFENSLALGFGAQTSRANQIAIGTATTTYTLRGLLSPASRAAQTGNLELVTVDANGNLASDRGKTVSGLQNQITSNRQKISGLDIKTDLNKQATENNRVAISQNQMAIDANTNAIETNAAISARNHTEIGRNARELERVSNRVDLTEAAIASNQDGISTNRTATQQNAARIDTNTAAIEGNRHRLGVAESAISQNTQDIANNTDAIRRSAAMLATTQQAVAANTQTGLANQAAIARTAEALDQHSVLITANQGEIVDNANEIDGLKLGAVKTHRRVAQVETTVEEHSAWMQGAQTTMASNTTGIEANSTQISAQANQLQSVSASVSTNQVRIAESAEAIAANRVSITQLESGFERLDLSLTQVAHGLAQSSKQIQQNTSGIAIANALAGSTWLQSNESLAFSLNAGYFDGTSALAFSGAARLHQKWSANLAIGATPDRGDVGARAGLRVGW